MNTEDEKQGHRKYYNENGIEVPSVTTICKLLDKPQLVGWANYLGFKRIDVNKLLNEKAEYGTAVHSICQIFFSGILDEDVPTDPMFTIQEYKYLIYKFKCLDYMLNKAGFKVIRMELPMEGKRVGGTLDMLLYRESTNEYMILDLKTSKSVYDSMFIQLGGYCQLMKEIYDVDISHVGIILISKEPKDKQFVNIVKAKDNKPNEEIFTKLTDIYYLIDSKNNSKEK